MIEQIGIAEGKVAGTTMSKKFVSFLYISVKTIPRRLPKPRSSNRPPKKHRQNSHLVTTIYTQNPPRTCQHRAQSILQHSFPQAACMESTICSPTTKLLGPSLMSIRNPSELVNNKLGTHILHISIIGVRKMFSIDTRAVVSAHTIALSPHRQSLHHLLPHQQDSPERTHPNS